MNDIELTDAVHAHVQQSGKLAALVQQYIKDDKIDLNLRWEMFELAHSAHLLPERSYIQHIDAFDAADVSWYDDFYKERYTLVKWVDIVERIEDAEGSFQSKLMELKKNLSEIRAQILAAGYGSFTYDW